MISLRGKVSTSFTKNQDFVCLSCPHHPSIDERVNFTSQQIKWLNMAPKWSWDHSPLSYSEWSHNLLTTLVCVFCFFCSIILVNNKWHSFSCIRLFSTDCWQICITANSHSVDKDFVSGTVAPGKAVQLSVKGSCMIDLCLSSQQLWDHSCIEKVQLATQSALFPLLVAPDIH